MDEFQALKEFWSSFGLRAYVSGHVPDNAMDESNGAYITFESSVADFDHEIVLSASIWNRSTSWEFVSRKAKEIYNYIGVGGKVVHFDDGHIWIKRGTPFAQQMNDEDASVRRIYINTNVEFFNYT